MGAAAVGKSASPRGFSYKARGAHLGVLDSKAWYSSSCDSSAEVRNVRSRGRGAS